MGIVASSFGSIPASVESSVLHWARESWPDGSSRGPARPHDRVAAWEVGEVVPNHRATAQAAEVYKLAVFFLSSRPGVLTPYATSDGGRCVGSMDAGLHEVPRRAHTQRDFALELADAEAGRYRAPGVCPYPSDGPIAARVLQGLDRGQPVAYPRGLG